MVVMWSMDITKLIPDFFEPIDEVEVGDEEGGRLTATPFVLVDEAVG